MSNQVSVDLEWKMNASAIVFTTVFGTVRRYWEEVICQAFGIDIDSDDGAQICGSFAVKEICEEERFIIVNARNIGTVGVTVYNLDGGVVEVWKTEGTGTKTLARLSFSEIVKG